MTDRREQPRGHGWGSLGVALVLALAVVLFAISARTSGGVDARQPQDLAGLAEVEAARVAELEQQVAVLQAEIEALTDVEPEPLSPADAERLGVANGQKVQVGVNGTAVRATVAVRSDMPAGTVFLEENVAEDNANALDGAELVEVRTS